MSSHASGLSPHAHLPPERRHGLDQEPGEQLIDGHSDIDTAFGNGILELVTGANVDRVTSFAIATKNGHTISGDLGFDYPGIGGVFSSGLDRCVAYGQILVD